ncbi:MAG TPA: glycosyltransferase family 2 protein [Thermomicrobiales bacterium]|nr:glycosyltransferase family 2 protein [Thermomicrobiales bacterium]
MTAFPATVVIVNYNGGETILRCVAALAAQIDPGDIIIVDNASTDGSSRMIHRRYPSVQILPLRHNVGFARAINIAAGRIAHDGALVTINPDTVPKQTFVKSLVQPLAADSQLGSTAGTLVFSSAPTVIASAGICLHRNGVALDDRLGEQLHSNDEPLRPVFGASGGAAAFRLSAFWETGGMAEPFFLYLEDVDLAWRLRLRGWGCVNVASAVATHDYSSSSVEGSAFKRRLLARNRIWTLARCLPNALWTRDRAAIIAFDLLAAGHGTVRLDTASFQGRVAGLAGLPFRLRERSSIHANARVDPEELSTWIRPAISPRRLMELRRLTASLAGPKVT